MTTLGNDNILSDSDQRSHEKRLKCSAPTSAPAIRSMHGNSFYSVQEKKIKTKFKDFRFPYLQSRVYDLFSTVLTGEKIGINKKISVEDKRIKLVNYAAFSSRGTKEIKSFTGYCTNRLPPKENLI